jgi:hypothetical protein
MATEDNARPGNYDLGSLQSRAAARAILARRIAGRKRLNIILNIGSDSESDGPRLGEWREGADGTLVRRCYLPKGMTLPEAEEIVSQPRWKPSTPPPKPERIRPTLKPKW